MSEEEETVVRKRTASARKATEPVRVRNPTKTKRILKMSEYLCCKPSQVFVKRAMFLSIAISLGLFFFSLALHVLIHGIRA